MVREVSEAFEELEGGRYSLRAAKKWPLLTQAGSFHMFHRVETLKADLSDQQNPSSEFYCLVSILALT